MNAYKIDEEFHKDGRYVNDGCISIYISIEPLAEQENKDDNSG